MLNIANSLNKFLVKQRNPQHIEMESVFNKKEMFSVAEINSSVTPEFSTDIFPLKIGQIATINNSKSETFFFLE